MKKIGPHLWGVQSLVKGSEDTGSAGRGAVIKALPENAQPVLYAPGKHPVAFLFFIVSVADGFEGLVTVLPGGSIATCPQVEAWTKPRLTVILNLCKELQSLQSPFIPDPAWGGEDKPMGWLPENNILMPGSRGGWHTFCLEKSVTRKVNPSHPLWVTGLVD